VCRNLDAALFLPPISSFVFEANVFLIHMSDFDIFLSHNSADKGLVEAMAEILQAEGLKPWLDKWCLIPGQPWQQELATILGNCPTFGIFIGQNGLGDWAREELLVAQDRAAKGRSLRVIPILLPGVPDPFDYGKLPPFLTQRTNGTTAVMVVMGCSGPIGLRAFYSSGGI
jgi:TIR domain